MISFYVALLLLPNLVYLMTMKKGRDYKKKNCKNFNQNSNLAEIHLNDCSTHETENRAQNLKIK